MASALCLVLLFSNSSDAQTVDPATGLTIHSTGNVLNLGGGLPWTGTVTGSAGGTTGGNVPAYNPSTGNIIFGYTQSTVSQTVAINAALAAAGTGIQVSGYKYQWQIHNDLTNYASNRGTLTGNVSVTGATGNVLESFNYNYNQNLPSFTTFSGTQLFNNRYDTAAARNLTVSFTGHDQNVWAGYYGPRVHVDNLSLLYTIDPCKLNPAYSSTCAGFANVVISGNLVNPNLVSNGNVVYNSFAVNTALQNSGSGVSVYGFNYGYNYSLGSGTYGCTATNQDGSCSWWMDTNPNATMKAVLTNSSNNVIYTATQSRSTPNTAENVSYQYLLPSTTNSQSLGSFMLGASTSGNAAIQNMYVNALYKPDLCVLDPLSSASCPGYAVAYAKTLVLGSTVSNASAPANPGPPQAPQPEMSPGQQPPSGQGGPSGSGNDSGSPGGPNTGGAPSGNANNSNNRTTDSGNRSSGSNASAPSLTSVLGMISTNQAKIAGTEKSVVQAAETQAAQLSQQAQQQAESVAGSLAAQSIAGSLAQSSGTSVPSAPGAQSQISTTGSVAGSTPGMISNGTGLRLTATTQFDNSAASSSNVFQSSSETYGLQAPQQFNTSQSIPEIPQSEGFKPGSLSVLSDAMEQRPMTFASPGTESRTETVKRDIPANDLARGIDIAAMALQPQGYAQYSVVMTDVPFYAPKEIYKNQNTVDNVRVLRQLSGDRLHQQLVESQYKQGE